MSESRFQTRRWLRFLIGGATNTAFTYALYLALNTIVSYQTAYLIAYVLGVLFAYWFNATIVFRVPLSWKGLLSYPIVYVVQYAASAALLAVLVEFLRIRESVGPLIVTAAMIPATYVMNKFVLGRSSKSSGRTVTQEESE
ncbi:GtrA family protein [Lysobacter enzymogenes]|uniref:GtrA family protein n=1 Tax=Lysobacter enzymogenes TaxID=69 RepID=UPI001A9722C7|nr:GtrA family protein [Lysobacter enzymogenes]QQP98612.1 GtrA family protein [Lysobacter enzymogenes]